MKTRPIPFTVGMVREIQASRKTQTRRFVKQVPHFNHCGKDIMSWGLSDCYTDEQGRHWLDIQTDVDDHSHTEIFCPYGWAGDFLYVREPWRPLLRGTEGGPGYVRIIKFLADGSEIDVPGENFEWFDSRTNSRNGYRKRPPMFLPKWASRITLEIVAVRVERLQDISEGDIIAEGCPNEYLLGLSWFRPLWESINGPGSWEKNPFVWVIEFRRVQP